MRNLIRYQGWSDVEVGHTCRVVAETGFYKEVHKWA